MSALNPASPVIRFLPYQKAWIADDSRFKIGMFSRQTGKTFSTGGECADDCFTSWAEDRRARWVILSRGERQAAEMMTEVIKPFTKAYYVSITAPIMGGATALVDLDTGSVTGAGARIAATVDGWHHVLIEGRLAATTVVDGINIWAANAAGATVFAADGVAGFDIWHPQIEAGAVCTSYIPTTNGAATRAADQLVLPARLGTRELTITTASWTVTLPAAEMTGDLRPAVIMPTHVQRIEIGPADGPQPIPVPVGGAGHWAEYWVTVRAPVMPEAVAAIARRLASVAPARCHLTRIDVDAVTVVVGGPWVVGAPDVTVGATYPTTEIL